MCICVEQREKENKDKGKDRNIKSMLAQPNPSTTNKAQKK